MYIGYFEKTAYEFGQFFANVQEIPVTCEIKATKSEEV